MAEPAHLFVAGVQRCGTSYLWRLLDDHPDVEMCRPLRPEPKALLDPAVEAGGAPGYRARLFPGSQAAVLGEKSTSYLDHDLALERIGRLFPDARVVVVLRDPVARAWSHYCFSRANGVETLAPEAVLGRPELDDRPHDPALSTSPFAYHRRGRYDERLAALWRHVPVQQTIVVFYEELVRSPAVVAAIYAHAGVDPDHRPSSAGEVVNGSGAGALPPAVRRRLAACFTDSDARLEQLLGRPLAWSTT